MNGVHALRALRAVAGRELRSFARQPGRLMSALVRPLLWFLVFAAGFQNVFGVAIAPPYETYIEYRVYLVPGPSSGPYVASFAARFTLSMSALPRVGRVRGTRSSSCRPPDEAPSRGRGSPPP